MNSVEKNFVNDSLTNGFSKQSLNTRYTWIRNIKVVLTSKKNGKQFIFQSGRDELNIDIIGTKNLALLKDKGTVTITNLPYDIILRIVADEYYGIEIFVGYGKDEKCLDRYFKGEVSFISQKIHSRHDVDTYITYASTYVAKFSQQRINLTLNSGINLYAAISYLCQQTGLRININPANLRDYYLSETRTLIDQPGNLIEQIAAISGEKFQLSTDESENGLYIDCTTLQDKRKIVLDPNMILIAKGNPTISLAGLKMTVLPMFNFKPGDIITVPNSMIDVSVSDAEAVPSTFNPNFLSKTQQYMIRQINYHFQNRASIFELNITAVAVDLLKNIVGAE